MANLEQKQGKAIEAVEKSADLLELQEGVVNDQIGGLAQAVEQVENNPKFEMKEMTDPTDFDDIMADTSSNIVHVVMSSPSWCSPCKIFRGIKQNGSIDEDSPVGQLLSKNHGSPKIVLHHYDPDKSEMKNKADALINIKSVGYIPSVSPGFGYIRNGKVIGGSEGGVGYDDFLKKVRGFVSNPYIYIEKTESLKLTPGSEIKTAEQANTITGDMSGKPQIVMLYNAANKATIEANAKQYQAWAGEDADVYIVDEKRCGWVGMTNSAIARVSIYINGEKKNILAGDYAPKDKKDFDADVAAGFDASMKVPQIVSSIPTAAERKKYAKEYMASLEEDEKLLLKNFLEAQKDDSHIWKFVGKGVPYSNESYEPTGLVSPTVSRPMSLVGGSLKDGFRLRKEAWNAFQKMIQPMYVAGKRVSDIAIHSSYRDYAKQADLYASAKKRGKTEFVAKEGTSEHQSALALDIYNFEDHPASAKINQATLDSYAKQYDRLKKNAHTYGFTQSYQKGEKVDGYAVEKRHRRYVGIPLATHLKKTDQTLTEFYKKAKKIEEMEGYMQEEDPVSGMPIPIDTTTVVVLPPVYSVPPAPVIEDPETSAEEEESVPTTTEKLTNSLSVGDHVTSYDVSGSLLDVKDVTHDNNNDLVLCVSNNQFGFIGDLLENYDGSSGKIVVYTYTDKSTFYGSLPEDGEKSHDDYIKIVQVGATMSIQKNISIEDSADLVSIYASIAEEINDSNREEKELTTRIESAESLSRGPNMQDFWNKQLFDESVLKYTGNGFDDPGYIPVKKTFTVEGNVGFPDGTQSIELRKKARDQFLALSKAIITKVGATNDTKIQINRGYQIKDDQGDPLYDHQSALAIDIYNFDSQIRSGNEKYTAQYEAMLELAPQYGFVQSKEGDDGHWRYVGKELATYLQSNNLTLQQYHDQVIAAAKKGNLYREDGKVRVYSFGSTPNDIKALDTLKNMKEKTIIYINKDDDDLKNDIYNNYTGGADLLVVLLPTAIDEPAKIQNPDGTISDRNNSVEDLNNRKTVAFLENVRTEDINKEVESMGDDEEIIVCAAQEAKILKHILGSITPEKNIRVYISDGPSLIDRIQIAENNALESRQIPYSLYDYQQLMAGTKKENVSVYDNSIDGVPDIVSSLLDTRTKVYIPYVYTNQLNDLVGTYALQSQLDIILIPEGGSDEIKVKKGGDSQTLVNFDINKIVDRVTKMEEDAKKREEQAEEEKRKSELVKIVSGATEPEIDEYIASNVAAKKRILLVHERSPELQKIVNEYKASGTDVPFLIVQSDILENKFNIGKDQVGYLDQDDERVELNNANYDSNNPLDFLNISPVEEEDEEEPSPSVPDDRSSESGPNATEDPPMPLDIMKGPKLKSKVETTRCNENYTLAASDDGRRLYIQEQSHDGLSTAVTIQRHKNIYDKVRDTSGEELKHEGVRVGDQKADITIKNTSGTIEVSIYIHKEYERYRKVDGVYENNVVTNTFLPDNLVAQNMSITAYSHAPYMADASTTSAPSDLAMLTNLEEDYPGFGVIYDEELKSFKLALNASILRGKAGKRTGDKDYLTIDPRYTPLGKRVEVTDAVHGETVKVMLQADEKGRLGLRIDSSNVGFLNTVKNDAKSWYAKFIDRKESVGGEDKEDDESDDTAPEDAEELSPGIARINGNVIYSGETLTGYRKKVAVSDPYNGDAKITQVGNGGEPYFEIDSGLVYHDILFKVSDFEPNGELIVDHPNPYKRYVSGYKWKLTLTVKDGVFAVTAKSIKDDGSADTSPDTAEDPLEGEEEGLKDVFTYNSKTVEKIAKRVVCDAPGGKYMYTVKEQGTKSFLIEEESNGFNRTIQFNIDSFENGVYTGIIDGFWRSEKKVTISIDKIEDGVLTFKIEHVDAPAPSPSPEDGKESAELKNDSGWINPWFDSSVMDKIYSVPKKRSSETDAEYQARKKTREKKYKKFKNDFLNSVGNRMDLRKFVTSKKYLTASDGDRVVLAAEYIGNITPPINPSDCWDACAMIAELGGGQDMFSSNSDWPKNFKNKASTKQDSKGLKLEGGPGYDALQAGDRLYINQKGSKTDEYLVDNHSCILHSKQKITLPGSSGNNYLITIMSDPSGGFKKETRLLSDDPNIFNPSDPNKLEDKVYKSRDGKKVVNAKKVKDIVYNGISYPVNSLKRIKRPSGRGKIPTRDEAKKKAPEKKEDKESTGDAYIDRVPASLRKEIVNNGKPISMGTLSSTGYAKKWKPYVYNDKIYVFMTGEWGKKTSKQIGMEQVKMMDKRICKII